MKRRVLIIAICAFVICFFVMIGLYVNNKEESENNKSKHTDSLESKKETMSEIEIIEKILGLQDSSLVVKEYHNKKFYECLTRFNNNNDYNNDVIEAVVCVNSEDFLL
ncbi:MAG: hypothetical protein K6G26_14070 [Lachnospiraceae bacterium]|nr:hypothetical protein [Lachnospiraceae bacterium]